MWEKERAWGCLIFRKEIKLFYLSKEIGETLKVTFQVLYWLVPSQFLFWKSFSSSISFKVWVKVDFK